MKPLSGAEVRQVLNKARYRWQGAQGATGTAITSGDGRVRVMWETGAVNGRIRFTETGYCSRFEGVRNVHVGRLIELDVEDADQLPAMCERLLANPLIEDYEIQDLVPA